MGGIPKYQYIAIVAGILTISAFSHLVYRVYLTKETYHLTYMWIFLLLSAQSLMFLYGMLNGAYGVYLPAITLVIGASYILYVKLNNSNSLDKNPSNDMIEKELKKKQIL